MLNKYPSRRLLTLMALVASTIIMPPLFAQSNKHELKLPEKYCDSVLADVDINPLWSSIKMAADTHRCRKDWVAGKRGELFACGDPVSSQPTAAEFKGLVSKNVKSWLSRSSTWSGSGTDQTVTSGHLGQRQINVGAAFSFNEQKASLFAKRPRYEKPVTLAVCAIDQRGNTRLVGASGWDGDPATRPNGNWLFEVNNSQTENTELLAVIIDFPNESPKGTKSTEFTTQLENNYTRSDLRSRGVADLHVHQTAELAFGGKLLWGSHAGPMRTGLNTETFTGELSPADINNTAQLALPLIFADLFGEGATSREIDANLLMRIAKPGFDDEGTASTGSRGFPGFEDWPHHADRSHQQVHAQWLRRANSLRKETGQNLSLMVSSIVNNDVLCQLLGLFDRTGNVPTSGNVGSESSNYGCSDFENLNRQIDALHALESRQSWFRIALSPWHAREIVHKGDLAVVISMESDKPLSDANALVTRAPGPLKNGVNFFEEDTGYSTDYISTLNYYHQRGVRSLQPVHESDSIFCGAAVHRKDMDLLQAIHWPQQVNTNLDNLGTAFNIERDSYRNRIGLTQAGRRLVREMVKLRMPIDLAHASNRCQLDILARVPKGYALYNSHTKFDTLLRPGQDATNHGSHVVARERGFLLTPDMESVYADHDILIGLRTASVDVYDAQVDGSNRFDYPIPNDCPGSALSFAQMVKHANSKGIPFAYGTDFNTGVSQLGPRFGDQGACYAARSNLAFSHRSTRPWAAGNINDLSSAADQSTRIAGRNYYTDGLAHIGMLPELTWDLQNEIIVHTESDGTEVRGVDGALELTYGARNFITMWQGAYGNTQRRNGQIRPANFVAPSRLIGEACFADSDCASNRCDGKASKQGTCRCKTDSDCKAGAECKYAFPVLHTTFNVLSFISRDVRGNAVDIFLPTVKNVCAEP